MVESTNNYIGKKKKTIISLPYWQEKLYMYIVDSSNAQLVMIFVKKKKKKKKRL